MRISAVDLFRVRLPLVRPFRTSFALEVDRDVLLVQGAQRGRRRRVGGVRRDVLAGLLLRVRRRVRARLREHLLPRLWDATDVESAHAAMLPVRGHPMSKSALETAVLDAQLREEGRSLATYLGAVRIEVDCGVSVGIPPDDLPDRMGSLLDEVAEYVASGLSPDQAEGPARLGPGPRSTGARALAGRPAAGRRERRVRA